MQTGQMLFFVPVNGLFLQQQSHMPSLNLEQHSQSFFQPTQQSVPNATSYTGCQKQNNMQPQQPTHPTQSLHYVSSDTAFAASLEQLEQRAQQHDQLSSEQNDCRYSFHGITSKSSDVKQSDVWQTPAAQDIGQDNFTLPQAEHTFNPVEQDNDQETQPPTYVFQQPMFQMPYPMPIHFIQHLPIQAPEGTRPYPLELTNCKGIAGDEDDFLATPEHSPRPSFMHQHEHKSQGPGFYPPSTYGSNDSWTGMSTVCVPIQPFELYDRVAKVTSDEPETSEQSPQMLFADDGDKHVEGLLKGLLDTSTTCSTHRIWINGKPNPAFFTSTRIDDQSAKQHCDKQQEFQCEGSVGEAPGDIPMVPSVADQELPEGCTTLVIRNIPARKTQASLLQEFVPDGGFDLFILPFSFSCKRTMGIAFINFRSPAQALEFKLRWNRQFLRDHGRTKHLDVTAATEQGVEANLRQFNAKNLTALHRFNMLPAFFDEVGLRLDSLNELKRLGVLKCIKIGKFQ